MHLDIAQFTEIFQQWLWCFLRVTGFLLTVPIIGTPSFPARTRILLGLAVTALLYPTLAPVSTPAPFSGPGIVLGVQETLIGGVLGLVFRFLFGIMELAGAIAASEMGLSFASMVDPETGGSVPTLGQFLIVVATLIFLGMDGHLLLLRLLGQSFTLLPVGAGGISREHIWEFLLSIEQVLAAAILLVLPALIFLLAVNLAFGVLVKAAPQLNLFSVGFPFMIPLGILSMLYSLTDLQLHLTTLFTDFQAQALGLLRR